MANTHIETIEIRELPQAITVDTDAVLAIQSEDGYFKLELSHLVALVASDALDDLVLDEVDNTSDLDKPLSNATIAALGDKADLINGILAEAQRPNILSLHLSQANFPPVGTLKVIYVARDTGLAYYYSATDAQYMPLSLAGNSSGSSDHFEHVQSTGNLVWTVVHNLDRYPSVTTLDDNGSVMIGEVNHVSRNSYTVTFSEPVTGIATAS